MEEYSYVFAFLMAALLEVTAELRTLATLNPETSLRYPLKRDLLGPSPSERFRAVVFNVGYVKLKKKLIYYFMINTE